MKTRHLNALSVIVVAALTLTPVASITAEPMPQITVSFADLNLSKPLGIAALYGRLQRAAHEVCGSEPPARDFGVHTAWSHCVSTALDTAVAQIHSAELAALHAKRSGQRTPLLVAKD